MQTATQASSAVMHCTAFASSPPVPASQAVKVVSHEATHAVGVVVGTVVVDVVVTTVLVVTVVVGGKIVVVDGCGVVV